MGAITSITLNNSADAAKLFDVQIKNGLKAKWAMTEDGVPVGYPTADMSIRPANSKNSRKVVINVAIPVLKEASASQSSGFIPAPEVQHYVSAHLEVLVPQGAPELATNDALSYLESLLGLEMVADCAAKGQFPY